MRATPQHAREDPGAAPPPPAPDAFVPAEPGFDYFDTEAHYRVIAERILGSVRDEHALIILTGDPPPSPHALSAGLDEVLTHQRPVIVLSCGSLRRGDALLDVCRGLAAHSQANDNQPPSPSFPLFIFDEAGRLSDEQITTICGTLQSVDHWTVVMLGRPDFLARLEQPALRLARDELTASLHFRELGRLEIVPFLHHQFGPGEAARVFTDEAAALLHTRSGGDPRVVLHLARKLLAEAGATADGPGAASLRSPPSAPAGEVLAAPPDPAARFARREAPLAEPDSPAAPDPRGETPPSADSRTLFDWLERRLADKTAAGPVAPASPLRLGQPAGDARDQPPPLWAAPQFAVPEAPRQPPDAATGTDTAAAASPSAETERQALPQQPVAPASSRPARRRVGSSPRTATVAVFCLAAVGLSGAVVLHQRGQNPAPAKAGVERIAAPTDQAAPAPSAAAQAPAGQAQATPAAAQPPSAAAEPPRAAPSPPADSETTGAPAAAPAAPTQGVEAAAVPPPPNPAAAPTPTGPTMPPVVEPKPASAPVSAPPPVEGRPAATETAALVTRGDEFFATGDVASARLFYERAADAGDAQAALRLGESFDPAFLDEAHVRGAKGDRGAAVSWYRRARALGSAEAQILLKSLDGN